MPSLRDELEALERSLLQSTARLSRDELARLLSDDFAEIGASGALHGKKEVLDWLPSAGAIDFSIMELAVRELAADVALVTYRAEESIPGQAPHRNSLRSSIWKRGPAGWQMVFHQGTPSAEPDPYKGGAARS